MKIVKNVKIPFYKRIKIVSKEDLPKRGYPLIDYLLKDNSVTYNDFIKEMNMPLEGCKIDVPFTKQMTELIQIEKEKELDLMQKLEMVNKIFTEKIENVYRKNVINMYFPIKYNRNNNIIIQTDPSYLIGEFLTSYNYKKHSIKFKLAHFERFIVNKDKYFIEIIERSYHYFVFNKMLKITRSRHNKKTLYKLNSLGDLGYFISYFINMTLKNFRDNFKDENRTLYLDDMSKMYYINDNIDKYCNKYTYKFND